ncbi:unnamed protein product [Peniophora sp. CBMAI 1063]|nr:unnamed protein product [Peniophora sp. CBMAI 1063]
MTEALLGAPFDLDRALQGVSLLEGGEPVSGLSEDGDAEQDAHYRVFVASAFIYACVDGDSDNWSNYCVAAGAEKSSISSDVSQAPRISVCESDEGQELLDDAVCEALPGVSDLHSRPSEMLSAPADVWRCPVEGCREVIRPYKLTQQQREVVVVLSGDPDAMIVQVSNGRFRLRCSDPWKLLRYIDALAWDHISWHLHRAHITFYYPHPDKPYKESPGWWWNEALLARDQSLLRDVAELSATAQQARRQWMVTKALDFARRKIQRASARLTRWRYDALQARRELVSDMFSLNRSIVEVSRALLALIRQQESDPRTKSFSAEITHYRAVEMEWAEEQYMWF